MEYFLSLMNYKIFLCFNLFLEFKNFYYNAGFYIGFSVIVISISLMITFLIKGMNHVKMVLYNNIPTKEKLLEIINKRKKKENKNKDFEVDEIKYKMKRKRKNKKAKTRISKDITIYDSKNINSNNKLFNSQIKSNPPPKKQNTFNLYDYIKKEKCKMKKREKNIQ